MIEKGRHSRPKIERNDRKCFICQNEVEDEYHFITKCPLYENERKQLYSVLNENSRYFETCTDEQKFSFIMINENEKVMAELAKFVFSATKVREQELEKLK